MGWRNATRGGLGKKNMRVQLGNATPDSSTHLGSAWSSTHEYELCDKNLRLPRMHPALFCLVPFDA
jgi:hypothetical protein